MQTEAAITDAGAIVGTVGYMSPEQAGGTSVDARSDIFSLGCGLYEMLAGRRAFSCGSPAETMAAILRDSPPELAESITRLPERPRSSHHALPGKEARGTIPVGPRSQFRPQGNSEWVASSDAARAI